MAGEKRDLEYFMANPHELPGSLGDLEAAVMGMQPEGEGDPEETVETTGEEGAASGTTAEEKAAATTKPAEQQQEQTKVDEPAPVVKSKDGKHEIPYTVLQTEREQRKAAETALQQMQQTVAELKARVEGGQGSTPAATDAVPTDEDIDAISGDFPAVGKMLKSLAAQVGKLNQELATVREREGNRSTREANTASMTVQEAIDANPTLSYLQTQYPEGFARAVQFDNVIKADPRNRGLSLDERFSKVVQAMEAAFGPTELPAEYQRAAQTPAAATPAPAAKPAQAAGKGNVAPKPAAAPAPRPEIASLSDIPGGVPPEADEVTQLGLLSAQDLGNKFMSMDPNKVLQILAKAA
jgi:hypothetical protein